MPLSRPNSALRPPWDWASQADLMLTFPTWPHGVSWGPVWLAECPRGPGGHRRGAGLGAEVGTREPPACAGPSLGLCHLKAHLD